jgi:hypothetical protein
MSPAVELAQNYVVEKLAFDTTRSPATRRARKSRGLSFWHASRSLRAATFCGAPPWFLALHEEIPRLFQTHHAADRDGWHIAADYYFHSVLRSICAGYPLI